MDVGANETESKKQQCEIIDIGTFEVFGNEINNSEKYKNDDK